MNVSAAAIFAPPGQLLPEAEFLAGHGIEHIHLIDPTFGLDMDKAHQLLDLLEPISKRYGITFETVTRADLISDVFARAMKAAGVSRCDIGMETMSNENLKAVRKRTGPAITERAVAYLSTAGNSNETFPYHLSGAHLRRDNCLSAVVGRQRGRFPGAEFISANLANSRVTTGFSGTGPTGIHSPKG